MYLSKELLTEDYCTNTFYIGIYWITKKSMFLSCLEQCPTSAIADHGGAHKLCVMELVKGADEMTMAVEQRWEVAIFCQFLNINYHKILFANNNPKKDYEKKNVFHLFPFLLDAYP